MTELNHEDQILLLIAKKAAGNAIAAAIVNADLKSDDKEELKPVPLFVRQHLRKTKILIMIKILVHNGCRLV